MEPTNELAMRRFSLKQLLERRETKKNRSVQESSIHRSYSFYTCLAAEGLPLPQSEPDKRHKRRRES